MITKILDRLYVGDSNWDENDLVLNKIGRVINVGGAQVITRRPLYLMHLSDDGKNPKWMFSTILDVLHSMIISDRVLVCCRAGLSRSVFIAMLWLELMGMSREESYAYVKEHHPVSQVNLDLLRSYP